jgi:hypothetical protein
MYLLIETVLSIGALVLHDRFQIKAFVQVGVGVPAKVIGVLNT